MANRFCKAARGIVALIFVCGTSITFAVGWNTMTRPNKGMPEVIGGPAAGCVSGAVELPTLGRGYQVMRLSRHRIFGHPSLIQYLRDLGEMVETRGLGVMLVGDLGQPRGGPTASLHRSHQNGLDVDIWYWAPEEASHRPLDPDEIEHLSAQSMVAKDRRHLTSFWTPIQAELIRLAALSDKVDRIFVNPVIKQALCDQAPNQAWLNRVRPWWNHEDHLHVRLRCPPENALCVPQKPVPPGNGCDTELSDWLIEVAKPPVTTIKPRPPAPILPPECNAVLRAP